MYRQLLLTAIFCSVFTTVLSVQCYAGTDTQCMLLPDMKDCGSGKQCYCTKYRFTCTKDDQACSKSEQTSKVKKWAYAIVTKEICDWFKQAPSYYENAICCSTNKCNLPNSGKCSWGNARRNVVRKITDLLDF